MILRKIARHIVVGGSRGVSALSIRAIVVVVISLTLSISIKGQILTFEFQGLNGNETSATSNFNDPDLSSSTITRGGGLTASNNGNRFNATNWATGTIASAVSNDDYMEFTVTPNSGFEFDVTTIIFNFQRSGTGPSAIALRSSSDSYASNIDGIKTIVDNTSAQVVTFTVSQTGNSGAEIYRVYGFAEATSGSGGFEGSGNDIAVNGTVNPSTLSCVNETFSNIPPNASYSSFNWTGDDGFQWNATNSLGNQSLNGPAVRIRGNGILSHAIQGNGIGVLEFNHQNSLFTASPGFDVYVNGVFQESVDASSTSVQAYLLTVNVSGNINLEIRSTGSNSDNFTIDDLTWTCFSCSIDNLGLSDVACDDNGTTLDASDDITSFSLDPTGSNLGSNYNVTVSAGSVTPTSAAFGSSTNFSLNTGSAGAGDVTITVTDQTTSTCSEFVALSDPGSCSNGECGIETFENSTLGGIFSPSGTITGSNGIDWDYIQAKNEGATYGIDNEGVMLDIESNGGSIQTNSPVPGGIGASFSCEFRRGNAGGSSRLELFINGVSWGESNTISDGSTQTFTVPHINIEGNVTIELRNIMSTNVVIDNINWQCFNLSSPYYQSVASGVWSDPTIWEVSVSNTGPWSTTTSPPNNTNSVQVRIIGGHTVTADVSEDVPRVIIDNSGILQTNSAGNTNLNFQPQGAGAELVINGTWIDNGVSNGIQFSSTSTWELGLTGTIIKTGNSSINNYKATYEGGMTIIPASANWIYRFIDNGPVGISVVNITYPNLTIESAIGSHDFDGTTETMNGSSSSCIVKGNLTIGTPSDITRTVVVRNYNVNASPVTVLGDLIIATGSVLHNVGPTSGRGLEVQGDIEVQGSGELNLSGGTAGFGILQLSGSNLQSMTGSTSNTTPEILVNELIIDKTGSEVDCFDIQIDVRSNLDLIDGILNFVNDVDQPADPNMLHILNGATVSNASESSFINGKIKKTGLPSSEFVFPVGDFDGTNYYYQPASLDADISNGTIEFDIQYFKENYNLSSGYPNNAINGPYDPAWEFSPPLAAPVPDCEANNMEIVEVSRCDYWQIDRLVAGGANVKLGLSWTPGATCPVIYDADLLRIAHFDPSTELWEDADDNTNCDDYLNDPTTCTGPTCWLRSNGVINNFSPFTLGQTDGTSSNFLPIELLSFSATPKEQEVLTEWTTASEIDNDFFSIERSLNAIDFEPLGYVTGAGYSHTLLDYSFVDQNPYRGLSYYRLKQTDFNGDHSYSDIEAVEFGLDSDFDIISAFTHDGQMNLHYRATSEILDLKVYDILGQQVHQEFLANQNGSARINATLASGAYLIVLSDGVRQVQRKVFW